MRVGVVEKKEWVQWLNYLLAADHLVTVVLLCQHSHGGLNDSA